MIQIAVLLESVLHIAQIIFHVDYGNEHNLANHRSMINKIPLQHHLDIAFLFFVFQRLLNDNHLLTIVLKSLIAQKEHRIPDD